MEKKLVNYEEKKSYVMEMADEHVISNDLILSWISIKNKRRSMNN